MSIDPASAPAGNNATQLFNVLLGEYQRAPVIEYPNAVPAGVKVSVCVPTYQHVRTIEKCLKSILEQDVDFAYEILLGEDGSSDGTRELCMKYANNHPEKIRLFLQSRENNIKINGYASGRFNLLYLLSKANGEYIALCEGDDWWTDKNKLRLQVQAMSHFPACVISCHAAQAESARYSRNGGLIGNHGGQQRVMPASDVILSGGGFCATLTFMFRRAVLGKLPGWLIHAPVLDYYLLALASIEGGCLYIPMTAGVYGNFAEAGSWTNRVLSNPKFAVDFETSFLEYLDKLEEEIDAGNRPAVKELRLKKMQSILFAEHLPWHYRASIYRGIRTALDFKFRLAWYLSGFGLFPSVVRYLDRLVKYLTKLNSR